MTSNNTTIYLDCSATVFNGLNTGIQRVVRNIVKRKSLLEKTFPIKISTVVYINDSFYEIAPLVVLKAKPITVSLGTKIKSMFEKFKTLLLKKAPWPKILLPIIESAIDTLELLLKKLFRFIKLARMHSLVYKEGRKKVTFNPSDTLVLLDAFWLFNFDIFFQKAKPNKVITVMYDLVPITHPELVEKVNCSLYLSALPWVFKFTDRFLCISVDVMSQLNDYCKNNNFKQTKPDYFHLGSDFTVHNSEARPSIEFQAIFSKNPVWLMVGTLEPRKNHRFALDAFDLLWKSGKNDCLLIIGQIGWMYEELLERIIKHPEFGKKLFFKSNVPDEELQYAYKKSMGLVFSSIAEGFGLPLVEAMKNEIKIICSDIAIFREIGGNYPIYFNLNDPQNLINALNQAQNSPKPHSLPWISWDESALTFMKKVLQE